MLWPCHTKSPRIEHSTRSYSSSNLTALPANVSMLKGLSFETQRPVQDSSIRNQLISQYTSSHNIMKLPSGYATETHWAWSMSDPSFHSNNTSVWAELLDDNYLFDSPKRTSSTKSRQDDTESSTEGIDVAATAESTAIDKGRSGSNDSTESLSTVPSRDDAPKPTSMQLVDRPRVRTQRSLCQNGVVDIGGNLQRKRQRQVQYQFIRSESAESIEEDDVNCECTGCKGRKARELEGQQSSGRSIQTRLNAISF